MKRIMFLMGLLLLTLSQGTNAQSSYTCADIQRLGIDKQMNGHAHSILQACGLAQPQVSLESGSSVSSPATFGGTDRDIVLGGEGNYPHVTQSETQAWAQGNTVVVAYNDSRTAPNCYSGGSYSTDGGNSWTDLNSRPFCSGHGTGFGDPVLVFDKKHSTWLAVFLASGCGGQGMGVWTSPDGINWTAGACAHNGTSDDRESGWVDNDSTSPFYGRFYLTWNNFAAGQNIYSIYSNDGGVTWSAPVQVQSGGFIRNVQVTTGPSGVVYIAGMNEGGGGLNARTNVVYRSTTGGASYTAATLGASFPGPGTSTCGYFAAMFPSYWRHMGWGDIGVTADGAVHYAFAQHGADPDPGDIYYTRSIDNGSTWSVAVKLNTDGTTRAQWQPSLSVTGNQVFVSWYDARNTAGNAYERFGILSTNSGFSFGTDELISDAASPLPLQPDGSVQACYAGDYDRSFGDSASFYIPWVDGRTLVNGNPQQDVYFDRVDTIPPTITLTGNGFKDKGFQMVNLSWSPTIPGDNIQVFRDGALVTTTPDDGAYTDNTGNKGNNDTYVYKVIRVETGDFSNLVTVTFGNR